MIKYIVLIILLNGILCQDFADRIIATTFPVGDPDNLYESKTDSLQEFCNGQNLDSFANVGRKYFEIRHGEGEISIKTIHAITSVIENLPNSSICINFKQGGADKFRKFASDLDKHVNEAQKVRAQFVTALADAAKADTKTTLPVLVCICKKWIQKTLDIYPEKGGEKEFIKLGLDDLLGKVLSYLETIKGKAPDNCELPAASEGPPKYRSIQIPFIIAVNNLIKK